MVEPSFNQMQVQRNIDLNFADGVRALLRQDPDIIMVGEIRDLETAEMAIQAALTGHLVVSTLHTNDAPSAITRLLELGVAPYLIKATLLGVMAQRLVRTLCSACKVTGDPDREGWEALIEPWKMKTPLEMSHPVGCTDCRDTGYMGRRGIYELMAMTDSVKEVVDESFDLGKLRSSSNERRYENVTSKRSSKSCRGRNLYSRSLKSCAFFRNSANYDRQTAARVIDPHLRFESTVPVASR